MTAHVILPIPDGTEHGQPKIPFVIHLACILLLVVITLCTGPLAVYFA